MSGPASTRDLWPSERLFVDALRDLWYGRFEGIRVSAGELVLSPPPLSIRTVKFGSAPFHLENLPADFALKKQLAEFFAYVRTVEQAEIRVLQVREGLPILMEIDQKRGGRDDA